MLCLWLYSWLCFPIELLQLLITYAMSCCTVFTCAVMLCGGWNEANVSKFEDKPIILCSCWHILIDSEGSGCWSLWYRIVGVC